MSMNFFKKVITFFSVIWNAISWRKNEKKGKQASQSTENDLGIRETDANLAEEAEKSFVDIPLHSPSGPGCEETPTVFTTCKNESDYGMKSYSSSVPTAGLEGNACSSLSFFSEPIRDDSGPQVPIIASSKNENDEVNEERVPFLKVDQTEVEIDEDGEKVVDETKHISEEKTYPSDNIMPMYSDDPSDCAESVTISSPQNNSSSIKGKSHSKVVSDSLTHDHITPNYKLHYSAIGDDIHLFYHEDGDILLNDVALSGKMDEHQSIQIIQDIQPTSLLDTTVGYAEADPQTVENNPLTVPTTLEPANDISVAPSHHLDEEESQESCSTYSTNYMVKSDSLVNFLPERNSGLIVEDVGKQSAFLMESADAGITQEEIIDCTNPLLEEDDLEEFMCTKKGILQLSGDHHCTDDMDYNFPDKTEVEKAIENELLLEEPLLKTHYLEGCALDETSCEGVTSDDISTFKKILRSNDAVHEDCQTAKKEGNIGGLEQVCGKLLFVGRDEMGKGKNQCKRGNFDGNSCDRKVGEEENPCSRKNTFSQSRPFQVGEDTSQSGQITRSEMSASHKPNMRTDDRSVKRVSTFSLPETESNEQFPSLTRNDSETLTQRFFISSNSPLGFAGSWSFSEPEGVCETHPQDPPSFKFIKKQEGPILGIRGTLCNDVSTEESPCSQGVEDLNEFHPFIDCSSFLFQIPKEIRKETSFNPCVGSPPSRQSALSNFPTVDLETFEDQSEGYEKKFTNMPSLVPCVENAPNFNPCLQNTGLIKIQSEYSHEPLPAGIWGPHLGYLQGDSQQNISSDYPAACTENYEAEYVNAMTAGGYENDGSVIRNQAGSYMGQSSSAVQFPVLGMPYDGTQKSVFLHQEGLAPIIFPLHPVNLPQFEPPSVMNLEAYDENNQYPNAQTFWEGHSAPLIQPEMNKEYENETSTFAIISGLGRPAKYVSTDAIDEDDDDGDNITLPDPYFHVEENTSLHTVRSKADSLSGSLFCESLRSIISHNTDNENVFPSFSYSSVQECCPSVVIQSCEPTLSNDSVPSVIVEDTSYSKSVDEDYLATEKFMNDVNTALNESVKDQNQGREHPLGNLLGRGDGAINTDLRDGSESTENEAVSRYSLGESISINNSKLTLLDGVLVSDSVACLPSLSQLSNCNDDGSDSTSDYCREVLHSLLESVFIPHDDRSSTQLPNESVIEANNEELQGDSLVEHDNQELVIVKNFVIFDGGTSQVRHIYGDSLTQESRGDDVYEISEKLDVEMVSQVNSEGLVKRLEPETLADEVSNGKGRRNKRKRKKSLDVDTKVDPEPRVEEAGASIGDGSAASVSGKQLHKGLKSNKLENMPSRFAPPKSVGCEENTDLKPKGDGDLFPNAILTHDSSSKVVETTTPLEERSEQQNDEEPGLDEEPGESSTNPSNNKRRRNRRKKRKN